MVVRSQSLSRLQQPPPKFNQSPSKVFLTGPSTFQMFSMGSCTILQCTCETFRLVCQDECCINVHKLCISFGNTPR